MRRALLAVVSLIVVLGMLPPPVFAQAPAPKVTITGLMDFVMDAFKNWSDLDPTNNDDRGWYTRERGRLDVVGVVGKSKAVWGLEFDFTNGFVAGAGGGGGGGRGTNGTSASFDLDTDVQGRIETKWLYVETPLTGPGSIMPFIPVTSMVRAGGQPARGHAYKAGILFSGDFPGVAIETKWAPNVKSTLTYAQLQEQFDTVGAFGGATESYGVLATVEVEVFKGLTVAPHYTYVNMDGGSGNGLLGSPAVNGFSQSSGQFLKRHTFGADVKFAIAGFTVQPTFLYQSGKQDLTPAQALLAGTSDVDVKAWIFDTTGGYRLGPLNLEGRFMYTPGMKASEMVASGHDVEYYTPINPGFIYGAGWTEIQTGGIDYAHALNGGAGGVALRTSPSYDKYGRIFAAVAADYSLTPALSFHGIVNTSWTAEKVDTDSTMGGTGRTGGDGVGDSRYLGTELVVGMTYRFAPNVSFDLRGGYMWTGPAFNAHPVGDGSVPQCSSSATSSSGGMTCKSEDVMKAVARVRLTF